MSDQNPPEEALAQHIAALLRNSFPGRTQDTPQIPEKSAPALTLADVAARLQRDATHTGGLEAADARALQSLLALQGRALPPRLTPRSVADYLATLGITASSRFCEAFAEAAIFLRMGRQQTLHRTNTKNEASGGLL